MSSFEAPHLSDVVDTSALAWLSENGYVREQQHPTEPLFILNYTDRAQTKPELFSATEIGDTLQWCRGLVYSGYDGRVLARPFRKFWNHGQPQADKISPDEVVCVTDKVDGSLGILYTEPISGLPAIATRGSFASDQAKHATKHFRRHYLQWWRDEVGPNADFTLLFEIVYPENRIVLDYAGKDDLFLLGGVDIESGHPYAPRAIGRAVGWPGPAAETFLFDNFASALAAPPRPNAEGYVIQHVHSGRMVKLKQEDYLELHRIVFGLSTRRIHEAIVAGRSCMEILEPLPDEFHDWARAVYAEITGGFVKRFRRLEDQYQNTMSYAWKSGMINLSDDIGWEVSRDQRKGLARLFAEADDDAWAMFALLDGKDISPKIWKELEPPAGQLPSNYTPKEA